MTRVLTIDAPAKINLGLEILGKRDDGFHEIRSILAMVDLRDTIEFRVDSQSTGRVQFLPTQAEIDSNDNLIVKAISAFQRRSGVKVNADVSVTKRIPVAAGLGGASSDCAATLIAMNQLADNLLSMEELSEIAAELGSDIPFFLGSPSAVISGRGTQLKPVRPPTGFAVLISPDESLPGKTRRLYNALTSGDFSDGRCINRQAENLRRGEGVDRSLLGNAFTRALSIALPETGQLAAAAEAVGIDQLFLSGAGPTHYALFESSVDCDVAAAKLELSLIGRAQVFAVTFRSRGLST